MKVADSTGATNFLFPVSNGLLTPKHRERIGIAVWEFAWMIDRTTAERDGWGLVLGGIPVTYARLSKDLGLSLTTVRENCQRLVKHGYLRTIRTPRGLKIEVRKSKKFAWKSECRETDDHIGSDSRKTDDHRGTDRRKTDDAIRPNSKEDLTLLPSPSENPKAQAGDTATREKQKPSEAAYGLADELRRLILENNPKNRIRDNARWLSSWDNWALEADRMMRLDGRTEAEIRRAMTWSQRDSFWRSNILSMGKLREKYDQLYMRMQDEPKQSKSNGQGRLETPRPVGTPDPRRQTSPEDEARYAKHERRDAV